MKNLDFTENDNQLAAGATVGGVASATTGTLVGEALTTFGTNAALPGAAKIGFTAAIKGAALLASPVGVGVGIGIAVLGGLYLLGKAFDD